MKRVHNFSAGPAALPLEALERARDEFLDFNGSGMSIMEQSHRGAVYDAVHEEAHALLKKLLNIPNSHDILLLQGGATQQFAQIPMNLRPAGKSADYVLTGVWGKKALQEASHTGPARVAATTERPDGRFFRVPRQEELELDSDAAYVHVTSNNTVMGTQFQEFPDVGRVPLVCDMSSDIMGRPMDVSRFGLIYAGAQKNLGPSGVTVVVVKKELVDEGRHDIPFIFQYRTQRDARSLSNTAPTFAIYMLRNVLLWLDGKGGVPWVSAQNEKKAEMLYSVLEERDDAFVLEVERESRSTMNVTWRLKSKEDDLRCVQAATEKGLIGLKGHRIVGGMRASIYNAVPVESVAALCEFLRSYGRAH